MQIRSRVINYEDVVHNQGPSEFKSHFRMTPETFELLVTTVGNHLERESLTTGSDPISVEKQCMMAVWWFATTETFRELSNLFNTSTSTAHAIVARIVKVLVNNLLGEYVKWPSKEQLYKTMAEIEQSSTVPRCVGCIDGCHIAIQLPKENAESYMNRKKIRVIRTTGHV